MTDKEFVKKRFRDLYLQKWAALGKTQAQFAEAIIQIRPDAAVDRPYVSRWVNGKRTPEQYYLQAICEVLEVDISEFEPKTKADKYTYSTSYQDRIAEEHEKTAIDEFGINLTLLSGLKQLIDFDSEFPVYSPLYLTADNEAPDPFKTLKYERMPLGEASEGSNGLNLFQIRRDGKVVTLSRYDMKYLKALQRELIKWTRQQFERHKERLAEAEIEANQYCYEQEEDNVYSRGCCSPELLQKIDKWGIYTEQEAKKNGMVYGKKETEV